MHQTKVDQSAYAPPSVGAAVQASAGGNYRWGICALLFFATTINYMDRQVLGLLAPDLQKIFRWNEIQYGYIVTTFQTTYALGLLLMGRFMDRLGTRLGYAISICIWSLAAMGHALANSAFGFAVARGFLGLGESGNFPAAIKTVTEWFPKKERALATGIFNSGTNVGAIVAPLTVPWIAVNLGWRWAFLFTGFFSATWLLLWLVLYRRPQEHSRISASELQYILSEPVEPTTQIAWAHLLRHRQTWAFAIGKFMTDPIWWFYLFWLAKFFASAHGLTLTKLGPPIVVIYLAADVGSISGGWLSSSLLKRGWSANRARKTAMLICALCGRSSVPSPLNWFVAPGCAVQFGNGRASGMVGQHIHHGVRHVSAPCHRFSGWHWRFWRCCRGNVHCQLHWLSPSIHTQLFTTYAYCGFCIFVCTARYPPAGPGTGASGY